MTKYGRQQKNTYGAKNIADIYSGVNNDPLVDRRIVGEIDG